MRRLLLVADVIGLVIAYIVALGLAPSSSPVDRVAPIWEIALFAATLPLWVLLARVYGLYDRDEERTDHSTVDDVVGVFQVVTLGAWSFLLVTSSTFRTPTSGASSCFGFSRWCSFRCCVPHAERSDAG